MKRFGLALVAGAALASPAIGAPFAVEEATIPEIARAFREHRLTCHEATKVRQPPQSTPPLVGR